MWNACVDSFVDSPATRRCSSSDRSFGSDGEGSIAPT
jgi:hypothetical protein